jgi:hypothetical protein
MKVRIIGKVLIEGLNPNHPDILIEDELNIETTVSMPARPIKGDILNFIAFNEKPNVIDRGKVSEFNWMPSDEKEGVLEPVVILEISDHRKLIPRSCIKNTIDEERQLYRDIMKQKPQPGRIAWKLMK